MIVVELFLFFSKPPFVYYSIDHNNCYYYYSYYNMVLNYHYDFRYYSCFTYSNLNYLNSCYLSYIVTNCIPCYCDYCSHRYFNWGFDYIASSIIITINYHYSFIDFGSFDCSLVAYWTNFNPFISLFAKNHIITTT